MIIHSQLELCEDSLQTLELRGVVLVSKVVKGCVWSTASTLYLSDALWLAFLPSFPWRKRFYGKRTLAREGTKALSVRVRAYER